MVAVLKENLKLNITVKKKKFLEVNRTVSGVCF